MHDNRFGYKKGWRVRIVGTSKHTGFEGEVRGMRLGKEGNEYLVTRGKRALAVKEVHLECMAPELQKFADRRMDG